MILKNWADMCWAFIRFRPCHELASDQAERSRNKELYCAQPIRSMEATSQVPFYLNKHKIDCRLLGGNDIRGLEKQCLHFHQMLGHGTSTARLLVKVPWAQVQAEGLLHDDTTVTACARNSEIKHVFKVPQASGAKSAVVLNDCREPQSQPEDNDTRQI
jgi:hypothetical protein